MSRKRSTKQGVNSQDAEQLKEDRQRRVRETTAIFDELAAMQVQVWQLSEELSQRPNTTPAVQELLAEITKVNAALLSAMTAAEKLNS